MATVSPKGLADHAASGVRVSASLEVLGFAWSGKFFEREEYPPMNRVAVFGSNGFLGRAVARALSLSGHDVVALGRADYDVSKPVLALERERPTAIINCAVMPDFRVDAPRDALNQVNRDLPARIARWCAQNDAHLVQPSAAIVHGVRFEHASPNAPINADTPYGQSKLEADEAIVASGCSHTIFRLGGIYGHNGPKHLGLNSAITAALQGRPQDERDSALGEFLCLHRKLPLLGQASDHGIFYLKLGLISGSRSPPSRRWWRGSW
jgi:hypothetical protein